MTTYHINLEDDVLKVKFSKPGDSNQIVLEGEVLRVKFGKPADGDQIVRDAAARLNAMIESGELRGRLLLIYGPASLPVCYVIAHKVVHLYNTVAIFDPKIGRKGYKTYIVASVHGSPYELGDLIETEEPQPEPKIIKVVLCGPPQSGKSCLREGLKQAISSIDGAPYPYVITACPDGEGAWFSEAARRDANLARQLKEAYKAKFTPEFAKKAAGWVRSANTRLSIIDVGGKMTEENRQIMREATHALILASDMSKVSEWREFCKSLKLDIIGMIHSDYHGMADKIETESPWLTGCVHYLERGEDVSSRPMVQALAKKLLSLVEK
ncbi:MAG: CRISPR-associated protein Csx3 [Brasilonema octagenarum HA4186-MV1]|jgi:CRISPR-associated protein Csx3|nr:CRISPR-associated protein Csx3 [Brasilonema octagenarum HA4186-MV1]